VQLGHGTSGPALVKEPADSVLGNHSISIPKESPRREDAPAVWLLSLSKTRAMGRPGWCCRIASKDTREPSPRCRFRSRNSRKPVAMFRAPNDARGIEAERLGGDPCNQLRLQKNVEGVGVTAPAPLGGAAGRHHQDRANRGRDDPAEPLVRGLELRRCMEEQQERVVRQGGAGKPHWGAGIGSEAPPGRPNFASRSPRTARPGNA
jgi:hypothetical protein